MEFQYDVFLSYRSADRDVVRQLAERLKAEGLRVWFDEWMIHAGNRIPDQIERGLQESRTFLSLMSPPAFDSDWVSLERGAALMRSPGNEDRRFIPVLLSDCQVPDMLAQFRAIDYRT